MSDTSNLGREAKAHVTDLGDKARSRLAEEADTQVHAATDAAADEMQSAADAADAAASEFDSDSIQAKAVSQIAEQIDGFADKIRATDLNTMVHETSEFARRNPLLFVGGAAALGFLATRFLKARDPKMSAPYTHTDPWEDHAAIHRKGAEQQTVDQMSEIYNES